MSVLEFTISITKALEKRTKGIVKYEINEKEKYIIIRIIKDNFNFCKMITFLEIEKMQITLDLYVERTLREYKDEILKNYINFIV